ncbi:MAG: XdhC family protein [Chthoniobacterales bacterium]
MTDDLLEELIAARRSGAQCAVATVAATKGSVPREAGAKMLVYADGKSSGTIGGGKFEAIVIADAVAAMKKTAPLLKTYPLHEGDTESFGAICGGEVTVLIEPQKSGSSLFLIGAGHCAQAIARLAAECGFVVTVVDDRQELLATFPANSVRTAAVAPPEFIASREWQSDEALIIVSRNYEIDREALQAALPHRGAGYLGMIGSERKVRRVFDELKERGVHEREFARVYAPLGLDIGADSPAEIAVSVIAEVLQVLRSRSGRHLRDRT